MANKFQQQRGQQARDEALIALTAALIVIAIVFMVYQIIIRPLPSNLDELVVSPAAIERLHKEALHGK